MKGVLKWPLILAALVVILRIVTEQAGAPDSINNLISVVVLYVLICPIYFALRIVRERIARPYATLLKTTALYTALARSMVIVTYWLAYIYQWPAPRFSVANGGVVGPNVKPINAYLIIPVAAGLVWILVSLVVGGGLGSLIIKFKRKTPAGR